MKKQLKSLAVTASSILSLLAITFTTAAASPAATRTGSLVGETPRASASGNVQAATSTCTKLEASDLYWATLDDAGDIAEKVDIYPSGTSTVTAAFDYNCIPKKTKLNIVWSIDGEQVLTDNSTPKPTDKANTYTYSLFMRDGSALSDGEYGVEFYIGEDLLTSGKITIGDTVTTTSVTSDTKKATATEVSVQGTVVDSKSKKPINGALVIVLNEGVDAAQWLKDGTDTDVMAFSKTDSKGQFELNNQVPTNTAYPWIIGAKGYKSIVDPAYTIEEGSDDPYILNITLERTK